jgi:hypothetical protein
MSKLLTMLMSGSIALTLSGFAMAQNQDADPAKGGATTTHPGTSEKGSPADPAAGGATTSKEEQEYLSALKKCEPLTGAEKDSCVEAARKKHGQM